MSVKLESIFKDICSLSNFLTKVENYSTNSKLGGELWAVFEVSTNFKFICDLGKYLIKKEINN